MDSQSFWHFWTAECAEIIHVTFPLHFNLFIDRHSLKHDIFVGVLSETLRGFICPHCLPPASLQCNICFSQPGTQAYLNPQGQCVLSMCVRDIENVGRRESV